MTLDLHDRVGWTLSRNGREITCTTRDAGPAVEVGLAYNGLPLATHMCRTMEEAAGWADELRRRWEAAGCLNG